MFLAKVVGTVVCTQKDSSLDGLKLLIVQPLYDDLTDKGKKVIAIDTLGQSGEGELVYLAKSNEAGLPLKREYVAADAGIMGIVDHYYIEKNGRNIK